MKELFLQNWVGILLFQIVLMIEIVPRMNTLVVYAPYMFPMKE